MGFIGVQPASVPLTASDITDGIISNAKLGADSVNASKVADDSISEEHLDITAITGNSAITSLADTDKFLVSDASDSGNLKYVENQYLGGSSFVELDQGSVSAGSSVAAMNFSNIFSSTYNTYFVRVSKLRFVGNTNLRLRFFSDTGTTEISAAYYLYVQYGLDASGNEERTNSNSSSYLQMSQTIDYDQPADGGITGFFYIDNPLANDNFSVTAYGQMCYRNDSNVWNGINFAGKYSGSSPRYGFNLHGASNLEYGDVTVYGIKP